MHPSFDAFIIFAIILNTATLACERSTPYPEWFNGILIVMNYVFTFTFTAEAIIKMIGQGLKSYIREPINRFDLLIVLASLADLAKGSDNGPGVFSAFRAFRLFKIFRLFKVGDLRILLDSITFTLTTISDYVILLNLFIYVFSLLGMSFYAGKVKFNSKTDFPDQENGIAPRANFDGLGSAILTIF